MTSDARAGRLHPPKTNQAYWVLTQLRRELEAICLRFLTPMQEGTLVDYGCGSMPYRPLFEKSFRAYVGCDLAGNPKADRIIERISQLPYDSNTVSTVLSTQVLEHVEDPAGYLREAYRVLATGGYLLLSTHGAWRYHPDPTDYWRWTSAGLRKQMVDAGFDVVYFRGILGPIATALQLLQDVSRGKLHHRLRKSFVFAMQSLVQLADKSCGDPERDADACVYVVVCVKPDRKLADAVNAGT